MDKYRNYLVVKVADSKWGNFVITIHYIHSQIIH